MPDSGKLSSDSLQSALAIAGLGCWVWDGSTQKLSISDNFASLVGGAYIDLPRDQAGWLALAHSDERCHLEQLFASFTDLASWQDQDFTLRLKHRHGPWIWFDVKARLHGGQQVIATFNENTRQKQTEAALRDSQVRYRALYTTSPLAFVLWDHQGLIGEWNRRAEEMFGWQAAEVIGKPIHRLLLPPEQHDEFRQAIKTLSQKNNHSDFSGPVIAKNGLLHYCNWYNVALRSAQGRLTGVLSLILDTTDEKVATEKLQKSEKVYRTLVETSPDGILLLGLDGRLHMANQQAYTLFSLDVLEDIGSVNIRHLLPPSGNEETAKLFIDDPDEFTGFIANRMLRMQRTDGQAFDASIAYTSIMDSEGRPSGIVLFVRDVTDKLRAERELENHRDNLEKLVQERTLALENAHDSLAQIIDSNPVPIFVLNEKHEVTHWNRACENVIGLPASQMIGTRNQWRAFYSSPRPVMADLVMTGEISLVEKLYQSKYRQSTLIEDGFEAEDYFSSFNRWLYFTAAPLRNSEGKIIGAIETLQDISERKDAEKALIDAKSIAETAANTKAEFLANMSHEIRTPMNAVIGLAHLLHKTDLSRKQQDYVSRIQGAGEMLLGLINDVLDFSKIEAGRMQLEHTRFSLDDILTNVATVVLTRAQDKGLELHYVVEPEVPANMQGDPLRLTQILVNLIGNAIKFTAQGSVTAFFRRLPSDDSKVLLEVDVQDTGIGMSIEQQGKLFQAFSQADTSITRHFGGTGLGLTISKRLVELMGGRIWVTSQTDIGSTFSFQVQLGLVADAPTPAAPVPESKNKLALVVDDNPLARTVLMRLLEKFGCQTVGADSGEAALRHLRESQQARFDYVTIDLNMPGMDGLSLARAIRELDCGLPKLVLVTAADTHALEESGALRHFHSALNKPITAAQIGELLSGVRVRKDSLLPGKDSALAGLRILLAEDIPTNQLIATEMLQSFGARVRTADNGRLAVEAIEQFGAEIDLVLMDMQMPEMDGLEATRRIRSTHDAKRLPIIAMTAHALDEERERCLSNGMNDFITKPVDPNKLYNTLLRWKPAQTAVRKEATMADPAPAATPSGDTQLPDLPGIDKANGLRRMMNKANLYERVLRDFHKRFGGEAALIRAALAANDPSTAERHAHSTKGLSGSIGALDLQAASLALEEAIRGGNGYPEEALQRYEQELRIVIDGIAAGFGLSAEA